MSDNSTPAGTVREARHEFERHADVPPNGIVAEFVDFLRHNKRWWLTPIVAALLLAALAVVLTGSAAAPFIYTLF